LVVGGRGRKREDERGTYDLDGAVQAGTSTVRHERDKCQQAAESDKSYELGTDVLQ
jgi:hypothetical protein